MLIRMTAWHVHPHFRARNEATNWFFFFRFFFFFFFFFWFPWDSLLGVHVVKTYIQKGARKLSRLYDLYIPYIL
jgi:hypothetical protein